MLCVDEVGVAQNGPSNFTTVASKAYKCLDPEERKTYKGSEDWKPLNCKLEAKKIFKDLEQKVIVCVCACV